MCVACFLHFKRIQENLEQLYALKFCVKLGKTAKDSKDTLKQAYGDSFMSMLSFYHWYSAFQDGRENVADKP